MSAYDYMVGADIANIQAGGTSWLEDAGNAVTKGLPAAVVSGAYGLVNTGVDLSNKLFGTTLERADTSATLHSVDSGWGDYYDSHKDAIDTAGFIAASLVPGTLAVKGLKLLQTGNAAGAFGKVLGYTNRMESYYLDAALKDLATKGGTVFTHINKNKMASIGWGVADNVIQTAAFETAAAASLKSSPMLEDKEWKDIFSDIAHTSMWGGLIGGGIGGLVTNKFLKDAGKEVEKKQRLWDRIVLPGNIDIAKGDDAFAIVDSILSLPKEAFETSVKIAHGGKEHVLDLSNLADRTLKDTMSRGILQLERKLTTVVGNDSTVGIPFSRALVGHLTKGIEEGAGEDAIRAKLLDVLGNLHSVEAIGSKPISVAGELRYLNPKKDILTAGDVFSATKSDGAIPYRVMADENTARIGVLGKDAMSPEEAYKKGFDAVLDPKSRRISISPDSAVYKEVDTKEADFATLFFNTNTMRTSVDVVPTVADIATPRTGGLIVNAGGVTAGDKKFAYSMHAYKPAVDSVDGTAQHLWASQLPSVYGEISSKNIPVLEAMMQDPSKIANGVVIVNPVSGIRTAVTRETNLERLVFEQKWQQAQELLVEAGEKADLREVAAKLNVSGDWLQKAQESNFDPKKLFATDGWTLPQDRLFARENLIVRYRDPGIKPEESFPDAMISYRTRVKEATERAQTASASVLGHELHGLLQPIDADIVKTANSQTVGASMLGSSNANYSDKLKAWAQYTGQLVSDFVSKRVGDKLADLQAPAARILHNQDAAADIAAAVTKARMSADDLAIYTDAAVGGKSYIVDLKTLKRVQEQGAAPAFKITIPISDDAADFLKTFQSQQAQRIQDRTVLANAHGMPLRLDPEKLYLPPIDTQRVPFFAFVRQSDGTVFGSSEVSMVSARSAAELQEKVATLQRDPTLKVIFKKGTEEWHKAKGDYDFARTMNAPVVDDLLRSKHKMGDYLPNMTPEAVVEDFVRYTQRQETLIVRDAVETNYAQQFAELRELSSRYSQVQTSKMEGASKLLQRNIVDPFDDVTKLALNISKRGEFTLWHEANEFVDALGTSAWRSIAPLVEDAKSGRITWEDANKKLNTFGIGSHYLDEDAFRVANTPQDRNIVKQAVNKANMLLANGMLRLDFANSLLNIISTPILLGTEVSALKNSLKNDPELLAKLAGDLSVAVPGTEVKIPSTAKLVSNAIHNLFTDYHGGGKALMERYKQIGTVKGQAEMFHKMLDDLSLTPNLVPSEFAKKVDSWVEKGSRLTFNQQAEDFTRFVTSDVMRQITEPAVQAGRMSVQEQNAFMTIFTNRVQGNYIASQRPILFQGTLGSAIGLFQTYQFNMFQQLFRHIENRDAKTLAVAAGLQGSLFGLNGLPMFSAINTQLLGNAAINSGHKDAYSFAVEAAGKQAGDWLMYGTASAFPIFSEQAPALWTRGDLNPRSMFIVPTSPLDVPAVAGSMKVVNAVLGMAKQVSAGANMTDALLFGLEHNGINRPLSGLAQVLKGNATTSKGDLISASQDWASIATFSRLLGAKPMDESIALTEMYRSSAYAAVDKKRLDVLGTVIKDKLRKQEPITEEDWIDLQGKYAAAGGRIQGFTQAMQRWDKVANTSAVNELMKHSQRLSGRRMLEIMGADPLEDYRNTPQE